MAYRFGDVAVELRVISPEQLDRALGYQRSVRSKHGMAPLLGVILVELGYATTEDVVRILTVAERRQSASDDAGERVGAAYESEFPGETSRITAELPDTKKLRPDETA